MRKKMDTDSQISKLTTRAAILAGVLIAVFGLFNIALEVTNNPIDTSIQFSIFVILLSVVFGYLIKAVEKISNSMETINLATKRSPTTVFNNSEDFFSSLLKASINCNEIYTHMLSEPPKKLGKYALEYFDGVNNQLVDESSTLNIFRRIATVHSREKAQWLIDNLFHLKNVNSFSLAIQYMEDGYPQTSFHVATSPSSQILFVWVTMSSGGFGQGFLVNDAEVAQVMKEEHDREFHRSIALKTGDNLNWRNIEELAKRFDLLTYVNYKKLIDSEE